MSLRHADRRCSGPYNDDVLSFLPAAKPTGHRTVRVVVVVVVVVVGEGLL